MHPISRQLCEAYRLLANRQAIAFPLTARNKAAIDSIVKTAYGRFFGHDSYPTDADKAASFFYLILKDHPVTDGNKRLAVLWLDAFTKASSLLVSLPEGIDLDQLALSVERSQDPHDRAIASIRKLIIAYNETPPERHTPDER